MQIWMLAKSIFTLVPSSKHGGDASISPCKWFPSWYFINHSCFSWQCSQRIAIRSRLWALWAWACEHRLVNTALWAPACGRRLVSTGLWAPVYELSNLVFLLPITVELTPLAEQNWPFLSMKHSWTAAFTALTCVNVSINSGNTQTSSNWNAYHIIS